MFTSIYIDNFKGISAPIELDFISKSRNKEDNSTVAKIEDGIYINKLIGIIGGNASGKTSIVKALNKIGAIITSPILQYDMHEIYDTIMKLDARKINNNINQIEKILVEIDSSVNISVQNYRRKKDVTSISVEMYINNDDEDLKGYYTYKIKLDGLNKKITEEFLGFRKRYRNKIKTIIDIHDTKESQMYYINRFYNNILSISDKNREELEYKYKYINTFINHYVSDSATISTGSENNYKELSYIEWYKKSPELFKTLVRVIDNKIKNISIDTDQDQEDLVFELKDGSKITREMLSTGTKRFLHIIRYANDIIEKNGILLVDEIEQNLHKELVSLVIRLFGEMSNNYSQILFTTLSPELFDIVNNANKKVFKQDSIYVLNNFKDDIKVERLIDILIDGERVKGDASVANLYRNKKISVHPDDEQIELFLNELKKQ